MSAQPSSGSDIPPTWPDRYARVAVAGLICGLTSLIPALLLLGAIFGFHTLSGLSLGADELLIGGAFLLALIGLLVSVQARYSTSRRWLAIVGAVLCALVAVTLVLEVAYVFHALYMACQRNVGNSCF